MEEGFRELVGQEADRRAQVAKDIAVKIEEYRAQAAKEGLQFTAVTPEQLQRKLNQANIPMIVALAWGSAAPGGNVLFRVGINNPGPSDQRVFAHVFVGLANIAPDVNAATAAVDARFPRMTQPSFPGLHIGSGATEMTEFLIPIPGVERTNYLGNVFVFAPDSFDVSQYLDRGLFVFEVT